MFALPRRREWLCAVTPAFWRGKRSHGMLSHPKRRGPCPHVQPAAESGLAPKPSKAKGAFPPDIGSLWIKLCKGSLLINSDFI